MQNGICPECGGTEIYTKAEAIWGYAGGDLCEDGGRLAREGDSARRINLCTMWSYRGSCSSR
jgi:hypothetical protein